MLENLRRFSALERPAQKLFLGALAALPLLSVSLKCSGFAKTRARLQRLAPGGNLEKDENLAKRRAALSAKMVNAADRRGLVHPSCLAKSLVLWWLLRCQGIACELRIGIRKEKDRVEAHAWVERNGIALNEPEEGHCHYAAFNMEFASLQEEETQPPGGVSR